MKYVFYLGCFLLPFENLFFAPSNGWAAITPIIFFVYLCGNIRYAGIEIIKYRKLILLVVVVVVTSILNFLFINKNEYEAVVRMINTMVSLGLGFISLFSFDIFFVQQNGNFRKIEKICISSYSISLMLGIIQFIAVKMNINIIRNIFAIVSKRDYLIYNRIQFTFTEPSFIGMHLFGVLLPLYFFGKNKKIIALIVTYCVCSIFFGAGVRIILDVLVVLCIYVLFKINFKKIKNVAIFVIAVLISIGCFKYAYTNNNRVQQIVKLGIYADGSLASRWFRVNATLKGYKHNPFHMLVGYGLGQEVYPLKAGYAEAASEYKSGYLVEVTKLRNVDSLADESVSYCFYTRVISECGGIIFIILLYLFAKRLKVSNISDWRIMWVIAVYLMVQFESYGFYTIWLMIVLTDKKMLSSTQYRDE